MQHTVILLLLLAGAACGNLASEPRSGPKSFHYYTVPEWSPYSDEPYSRYPRSTYHPYSTSTRYPWPTHFPYSTRRTHPPYTTASPKTTETQDWYTTYAPEPYPGSECSCTYENIWLDVFFLIDSSNIMTSPRFDNAVAFALSLVQKMTVGQAENETRVGWIEFAKNATTLYNLTHWHSTEEMTDYLRMTYDSSAGVAVKSSTNYSDAVEASLRFKAEGGEIITVEYAQGLCKRGATLGTLATSPSYVFSNCHGPLSINKVRKAFCDVNCFCMKHYELFGRPTKRCYRSVGIPSVQRLASRSCKLHYSTLAKVDSYEKAEFLAGLMPPWESKFWIGLHRYYYDTFVWPDGEMVRNYTFNMWYPGYPKYWEGDCVYMSRESGRLFWFNADCENDENYVCERRPCDTDNFCSENDE